MRLLLAAFLVSGGCGSGAITNFSGGIQVDSTNTFDFPANGGRASGNASYTGSCKMNVDGSGEYTVSYTLHLVLTDGMGGSATTDVSGSDDQHVAKVSPDFCGASLDTSSGSWVVNYQTPPLHLTGKTTTAGGSVDVSDNWENWDYLGLHVADLSASGTAPKGKGALVGMKPIQTFYSGNPLSAPATLTWSLNPK